MLSWRIPVWASVVAEAVDCVVVAVEAEFGFQGAGAQIARKLGADDVRRTRAKPSSGWL